MEQSWVPTLGVYLLLLKSLLQLISSPRSFAWMRSGLGGQAGKALSVNMFMFNNTMSMNETIFTMDVANDE